MPGHDEIRDGGMSEQKAIELKCAL